METQKHPARTLGWVVRICRSGLSPGKATSISLGRNPIGTIQLYKVKVKLKTTHESSQTNKITQKYYSWKGRLTRCIIRVSYCEVSICILGLCLQSKHVLFCFGTENRIIHYHQSLNREGRWGTTDDFATSFLHFSLFSTALWDLPNSRPVHSLKLSSHLFLCLPCLLPPFTVPCKMILARPDERETWPYHCSLRLFTIVRKSSCGPIACRILARTSSLVTWSLYEMCSILR